MLQDFSERTKMLEKKIFCVFQGATHLKGLELLQCGTWSCGTIHSSLEHFRGRRCGWRGRCGGFGCNDLIWLHESWQKPVKAGSLKPDPITARGRVNSALWSRYHWHTCGRGWPSPPSPHEVATRQALGERWATWQAVAVGISEFKEPFDLSAKCCFPPSSWSWLRSSGKKKEALRR